MRHIQRSILLLICLTVLFASFVGAQEKQSSDLFKIKVNGKYGFIDRTGKVVIEPQFQGVDDFSEDLAEIYVSGKFSTAYIDTTGKIVIQPQFDIGSKFSEGFAWVGFNKDKTEYKIGNRTFYNSGGSHSFNYDIGFIDRTGKFITEPIFTFAGDFSEGLAFVRTKNNKYGYIDKTGKFAIQPKFDWAENFSEGLALVFVKGKYGFIGKSGKLVIKPQFTKAESFSEGLACVKIGGATREPNFGSQIITTTFDDTNYAYIDKTGKIILKLKAGEAHSFSEGLARFEPFGDYRNGFIDKSGKVVIKPQFSGSSDFSDGLANVIIEEGGFAWIDKKGEIVLKSQFPFARDFENGLSEISDSLTLYDSKNGYIDKKGKVIWQPTD
jgi:WG containing repeat